MKGTSMTRLKNLLKALFLLFLVSFIYQHEYSQYQFEQNYQPYHKFYETFKKNNEDYQELNIIEKIKVRDIVLRQVRQLSDLGWQDQVIQKSYLKDLQLTDAKNRLHTKTIERQFSQSLLVGSSLFKKMWTTEATVTSSKDAKQKLELLINCLHLPDELSGKLSQTVKLLANFDENMTPTDSFWDDLSTLIQIAFPDDSMSQNNQLAKKVHQLRYLISAQQAHWVRKYYKKQDDSDEKALAKYLIHLSSNDYSLTESARYHNKVATKFDADGYLKSEYADNVEQSNFKVLIHFHSEFILSESGQFLVAMDAADSTSRNSIINSASFNYANQNDDIHKELDVNPITYYEPEFIIKAMTDGTNTFITPTKKEQKDKTNDIYSRDGKSSKQLTKEATKRFKKLISNYKKIFTVIETP